MVRRLRRDIKERVMVSNLSVRQPQRIVAILDLALGRNGRPGEVARAVAAGESGQGKYGVR